MRRTLRRRGPLFLALAAAFPFLFYIRYVVPSSSLLVIGNDFGILYYSYKAYLSERIAAGSFPLWSPAEGCGYSFFANPFTAPLYPLNVLPVVLHALAGHYNRGFHQAFAVLGVSIFSAGTYLWLVASFRQRRAALFTACVLSSSWAVSSFLRLPNAVHVLAWTPWVLLALLRTHQRGGRRYLLLGIAAFTCQITAGYPYFVVYAGLLYALYLALRLGAGNRDGLLRCLGMLAVPVLVTAPYASAVSRLMAVTTDRSGHNFAYSTQSSLTPIQLVGGALFPPVASAEGCLYGGFLTAVAVVLYFRRDAGDATKRFVFLASLAFLALALGSRSYLYSFAWNAAPLLHQMRGLARGNVFLIVILGIAVHRGFARLSRWVVRPAGATPMVFTLVAVLLVLQVGLYLGRQGLDTDYATNFAATMPPGAHVAEFVAYGLLTALVLLALPRLGLERIRGGQDLLLGILLVVATTDAGSQGRFLWSQPLSAALPAAATAPAPTPLANATPVAAPTATLDQARDAARALSAYGQLIDRYFLLDRPAGRQGLRATQLTYEPMENFYYASYNRFLAAEGQDHAALARLMGARKLHLHERATYPDLEAFLADATAHGSPPPRVTRFDGNRLELEVETGQPLYLSWIDNLDAGWSATVDGQSAALTPLFGTFKSVQLATPGRHVVVFRYWPSIAGPAWVLSGLGVALLALLLRRRGPARAAS